MGQWVKPESSCLLGQCAQREDSILIGFVGLIDQMSAEPQHHPRHDYFSLCSASYTKLQIWTLRNRTFPFLRHKVPENPAKDTVSFTWFLLLCACLCVHASVSVCMTVSPTANKRNWVMFTNPKICLILEFFENSKQKTTKLNNKTMHVLFLYRNNVKCLDQA